MLRALKNYISRQFLFPPVRVPSSRELDAFAVVITGASRGIGKAIAEMVYHGGGRVAVVSQHIQGLRELFPNPDERVLLLEGDVALERDAERIVECTVAKFGRIDVLVNNAGINIEKPLDEITGDEFDRVLATNLKGAFLMSQKALPGMKRVGRGLILNIGSKISHNTQVGPNKVVYAATKYALEGFSFALNRELKDAGIRVTCLMPGTVNTFVSTKAKNFLSPYQVAEIVSMIIRMDGVDFEGIILKSEKQDI